jgi:TolA-binding protein
MATGAPGLLNRSASPQVQGVLREKWVVSRNGVRYLHSLASLPMPIVSRFSTAALICIVGLAVACGPAFAQTPPPAAPTLDEQLMQKGEQLSNEGRYVEAAAAYEELVRKYPTSPFFSDANFRAGYTHYLGGEYDDAVNSFNTLLAGKSTPPGLMELALSMTPQVLAAKAAKLLPGDPARKAALDDAVKKFDVYLQKYPNSDEVESANFGKGLALFQLAKYEDAATVLRANVSKFTQSPTMQDSQYMLAVTYETIANDAMQTAGVEDKTIETYYDNAEKLLRDIIAKRFNVALVNDAQFQVGELLLARAGFMTDKAKQEATFAKAIEAFHEVQSKDYVIQAQKERIAQFTELRNKAAATKDLAGIQRYKRVLDKEQEKLAQIQSRQDQTVTAKFKCGVIYFEEGRLDEARVLFSYIDQLGLTDDPEQKKLILYFVTMTYAAQNVADKAVEKYNAFEAGYKGAPIAENLQLVMGSMFLSDKPKLHDPAKAIQYFKEGLEIYPKGKFVGQLILAQSQAMIQMKDYTQALTLLDDPQTKALPKDQAVDAAFYKATILDQTGHKAEAVAAFKTVRDTYPGTPQAEQSSYQVGQLLKDIDPKAAVAELTAFVHKFPNSQFLPQAMFALGSAQALINQKDAALATYKELGAKFPKSPPAPFSYFERGKILADEQKYDECVTVMREFIAAYPDQPDLYQAYDFIAQILNSQRKGPETIATYEEFVEKRPKDPGAAEALLKLSSLWKGYAESQGPYLAIDEKKREEWKKGVDKSIADVERLIADFPESQTVGLALNNLLDAQRLLKSVKLKTEAEIEQYFHNLAARFANKPGTQSKVLFTLASFTFDQDKAKALHEMESAYKPALKFAPEDLDLYGQALIDNHKLDEALKVYEKLEADYPLQKGADPKAAPRATQEAQAIALAGLGKAFQEKGDSASKAKAAEMFADLEKYYPWSPKMLEVNYGTAVALHDKQQDEDAVARLRQVIKAQKASAELRAKSMLLLGKIFEADHKFEAAIDNYIKIATYYGGVPKIAAEGLWRGAQLMERQGSGEIPMPTPTPKPAPGAKASPAPKASSPAPKASPVAPKASPGAAKASPVAPKASPAAAKASPVAPKASPAAAKALPAAAKASPVAAKASPAAAKVTPNPAASPAKK